MQKTKIEWCDLSVNPIRARRLDGLEYIPGHFCEKISAGCKNCYASRMQPRFGMLPFLAENRKKVAIVFDSKALYAVRSRKKPSRIFWCDMTDMFLKGTPFDMICECFHTMIDTPQHTHLVLTKRPDVALQFFAWMARSDWPKNIHFGVSVEDQPTADERIPLLLQTPAAVRWVSYEPALAEVNFLDYMICNCDDFPCTCIVPGIDWLVCGGESGPGARPMHPEWARSARDQCVAGGVPFFFKQWGEYCPAKLETIDGSVNHTNGHYHWIVDDSGRGEIRRMGKKSAGRLLDGREWSEYPR